MTGMFQSSRIASGKARLQTSSAFSPSSASMIWKSRLSRMRRATFRMTLESSTTRHVLISASNSSSTKEHFVPAFLSQLSPLRRLRVVREFEDAVDIEDDHELSVQSVNTAGELGHAGIEVDGVFLAAVVGQLQDLADVVDQEGVGFPAHVDADRHWRPAVLCPGQPEPRAHVH